MENAHSPPQSLLRVESESFPRLLNRLVWNFHLFGEAKSPEEPYAIVGGIEEEKYEGRKEEFLIKPNRLREVCFDCQ